MNTLQERMAIFMRETQLSITDIAKIAHVSRSAVSQWKGVKGKASQTIKDVSAAVNLQKKTGFSAEWLASGTGPMRVAQHVVAPESAGFLAIHSVTLRISGGADGYAIDYVEEEGPAIFVSRAWIESNHYDPSTLRAARVINGSMAPRLNNGDVVVFNTADVEPADGILFAISYDGELVIKRLIRDQGQWWLSSDNPDKARYPRKACTSSTRILGRALMHQSQHI